MQDILIGQLAMNISTIILHAMKNAASDEQVSPDTCNPDDGGAVDEVMNQLSEHIMVELTKSLVERAKRVKSEEVPSAAAVYTVKRLGVAASERITKSMDNSTIDTARKISDAKLIIQDMQMWGKKQWSGTKKNEFLTYTAQLYNILEQ
ncbi:hypothetical protein [Emiliania huxleyi virus 99B1]|nr:hypothetical protein EhVM1_000400 [Emiliania huxleyi virus M1]CAZ69721.1 hypothetical protein [Emiliania huxleyi virus 99B1]